MKIKNDWNPELYLKFSQERMQPSIDLVNRINIDYQPKNILDIGCGPGNSSQCLVSRWPCANFLGIDRSPNMIDKARKDFPKQDWQISDASVFLSEIKYDIVFSNATIQWIPNHDALLQHFIALLSDNGVLAIQVPQFFDMPIGIAINTVASFAKWKDKTIGCKELFTFNNTGFYYDLLCSKLNHIDMWVTEYMHVLGSYNSLIDFVKSTGMKPFLDFLPSDKDKADFTQDVLCLIRELYPTQINGNILFPFKRLFFVGYR